ncbi:39S ribosomal protein L3, mitochondrial [Portunus trituberculatus]|uniref:Large ribosomal subunit protein uL3m n=1 Tax=Portunus trituberculatus TaxID=210409 RepID=A0A5B7CTW8_PORTR|nr:39S ribosomal protein L3, mitochondrial [Portunus trituberculatus]
MEPSSTARRMAESKHMPTPVCMNQVRAMSRVKRRHTVPPFWLPKTTRAMYPEHMTPENEIFLKDVIEEKYSSPLKADCWERGTWVKNSMRCGLIGRKIGIYPMWTKDGTRLLTTLLQVSDNQVIKYIKPEDMVQDKRKRYRELGALVVGADPIDPRIITKEYYSVFSEAGVMPKKKMSKFLITPNAKLAPGTPLYASHFQPGHYVDIAGITIDRGFQGVMKRWGFKGMPASHGVTKSHRRGGNIGSGGDKARVLLGTKMPGNMGRERRILRGLKRVPQLADRWGLHCSFLFSRLICSTPVEDVVPEEDVDDPVEAVDDDVLDSEVDSNSEGLRGCLLTPSYNSANLWSIKSSGG